MLVPNDVDYLARTVLYGDPHTARRGVRVDGTQPDGARYLVHLLCYRGHRTRRATTSCYGSFRFGNRHPFPLSLFAK